MVEMYVARTNIIVPLVSTLYKPMLISYSLGRYTIQQLKPHTLLRILSSVWNEKPIPSIINLSRPLLPLEICLCVYTCST